MGRPIRANVRLCPVHRWTTEHYKGRCGVRDEKGNRCGERFSHEYDFLPLHEHDEILTDARAAASTQQSVSNQSSEHSGVEKAVEELARLLCNAHYHSPDAWERADDQVKGWNRGKARAALAAIQPFLTQPEGGVCDPDCGGGPQHQSFCPLAGGEDEALICPSCLGDKAATARTCDDGARQDAASPQPENSGDRTDCERCKGSGVELRQGNGEWISDPCPDCGGSGTVSENSGGVAERKLDEIRAEVEEDAVPEIWIGFANGIPYISKSPSVLGEAGPVAVRYAPAGPADGWPAVTLVRGSVGDAPVVLDPTVGAFEGEETRRYVPA